MVLRDDMNQSVEIALSDDHQAIDEVFETYLITKRDKPAEALAVLQNYAALLLRHMKCEEELVFPALARYPDERACQEIPVLLDEHQIILPFLREVEAKLRAGEDPASSERRLFEELHEHNAREEMFVYAPLDRLLTETERVAVLEALQTGSG